MIADETHRNDEMHRGLIPDDQLASGTATSGFVPIANGAGFAAWGAQSGGGGATTTDFLTGNDVDFDGGIGAWVASALGSDPTLSRDATYRLNPMAASLKAAFTANANRFIEVPVTGSFELGETYWFTTLLSVENTDAVHRQIKLQLGIPGGDIATLDFFLDPAAGLPFVGTDAWVCLGVRWQPTSTHASGVKARATLVTAQATALHLSLVRVVGTGEYGGPPTTVDPSNNRAYMIPVSPTTATGNDNALPLDLAADGGDEVRLSSWLGDAFLSLIDDGARLNGRGLLELFGGFDHAAGDKSGFGVNVEAGEDFVGFIFGEKNATTGQFYADFADYDFEFTDGASGKWKSLSGAGVTKPFATMENRVSSGTATITSGTTAVTVTHGAGYTPTANDIRVVPTNNPTNDPGNFWIDTIGATTFKINVRANPGASGASFAWAVDR